MDAKTILIAEDNQPTRELMANILTEKGYKVIQTEDAETAMYVALNNEVHCALIDQYMTPKGGFDFAALLDPEERPFPMVMITAYDTSDLLIKARDAGFVQLLKKPVAPERLLKTVEFVLRQARA